MAGDAGRSFHAFDVWQASRSAAIAEHAGDDAGYTLAKKSAFGKDIANALRALKGEG